MPATDETAEGAVVTDPEDMSDADDAAQNPASFRMSHAANGDAGPRSAYTASDGHSQRSLARCALKLQSEAKL